MHATGNVFFPLSAGALARLLAHHKHAFMASGDQIAWIQTHHGNEPACSLFCVSVSWLFSHHLPLFFLCCCPTMSCVCVYFIMARQPEGLHFVCYCHHQNGVKFSAVLFFLGWRPNCDYPACIDALQKRTKHITVDFFRLAAYAKRVGLMSVFI